MRVKIVLFLFTILFIACNEEKHQLSIDGKITNYSKDYVLFINDTIGCGLTTSIDTIRIDNNGSFNINNVIQTSNAFLMFEDAKPIRLIIPRILNSHINIELDCSMPDSIKIEGEQAAFIQFYIDQQKYWKEIHQEMSKKHTELVSRDNQSKAYHIIQDTITQLRIQYLNDYFKDLNISGKEVYIANERNSLLYSNLYYRMSGQKNEIINQLAFYKKSKENSVEFLTHSDEIVFSDKNLFLLNYYREFMNDFIMSAVRIENPKGDLSSFEFYLNKGIKIIDEWFHTPQTNGLQKIVFINHLVNTAITFKESVNINEFQNCIETLRNNKYASKYIEYVENNLEELNNSMLNSLLGTKAPNIELKDITGEVHRLSDFKDKIIFINVWASWCKPCISSLPKWNDLGEKYSSNKNYQFISVSIDENFNKWIDGVEKFKPIGLKLHAGNEGFDSPFAKSFEINGIPKYFSINKEGNFISVSTSTSGLQEIINKIEMQEK